MYTKIRKRVAVFPAGSEIGLEINAALKYSTFFEMIGLTSVPCHAEYVYAECIEGIPFYSEPGFFDALNFCIQENHIDYIYPAYDDIQLFLTENQDKINAGIVTSDLLTVQICRSKSKTYDFFQGEWFIPKSYTNPADVSEYPVFVKPNVGQGSQGARKIDTEEELRFAIKENPDLVICEYLPMEEYTIDCFTDRHGALRVVRMRNRLRIRNGISVASARIPIEEDVQAMAELINGRLKFTGAWFFQVKRNMKGQLRLLEIAPRIAGTMGLTRNEGINLPLLTLFTLEGRDVSIIQNEYAIQVDRALISRYQLGCTYRSVYVDLDDTLIVNGQVNTLLMMFLYQCRNKGKELLLLTRHSTEVPATLQKYRIAEALFDKIIHIKEEGNKSDYIERKEAIFIDDSFRERLDVSQRCGIPVFDCSEVEALLDWRVYNADK
jgi:hypothetical protein